MRFLRTLPLCLLLFVASTSTPAQSPTAAVNILTPRIVEKIDKDQLVPLKGNTLPVAKAANDLGAVSADLQMNDLLLVLTRAPEQQTAFDEFVASQYDSSSPNFHHWLQPAEVGERFGPSPSDIATITDWLTRSGFSVSGASKDRMGIRFSGTAGQVQSAFHTEMHALSVRGQRHVANLSDPQIPLALAPVIGGIKGLHDFRPKPLHKLGGTAARNPSGHWERVGGPASLAGLKTAALPSTSPRRDSAAHPDFGATGTSAGNTYQIEDVAPYDFAAIYNVAPLWNATPAINGSGQTIAVVGTSDIVLSDVATFRSTFGLPSGLTPIQVKGVNGTDPGVCTSTDTTQICNINDLIENSLDVEWSAAVAPGAQIVLVTAGQSTSNDAVYDASSYVVQNIGVPSSPVAGAHILNVSYGLCELFEGTSGNAAYNNLWQTAATEGIAVFVASGDAASADCDQGFDASGVPYLAQYGLSVSGLASSPYDTAVGGTDLNWGSTAAPYWNTTNATTGASAKGYMPEVPWNDTCTNPAVLAFLQTQVSPALKKAGFSPTAPTDAESSCQFILTWYQQVNQFFGVDLSGYVDTVGSGGGASSCTTGDSQTVASCTGGYAKPSWQANVTGIPSDGKRDIPDVSFFASNGFLSSAYLICVSANGSCSYTTAAEPIAQEVGGTSVAAPAMAGIMALVNQKMGVQGNPNAELYNLASKQTYGNCSTETGTISNGCYFNDIDAGTGSIAGNISSPCQPGTPNCTVAHTGDSAAVLSGYDSGTGFDLATGLGSMNVANVVNAWTTMTGSANTTLTATPSASAIAVNVPVTISGTVATASGTEPPTGNIVVSGAGYSSAATALSNGSYSITIPASSLASGNDTLTASYAGDFFYAPASATTSVTVTKLTPGGVTVTPSATTLSSNATLTVTGTVAPASGGPTPIGTITLSGGGYTSSAAPLSAGSYSISIPPISLGTGADSLTVTYSGDANYLTASNAATVTVTASYAVTATSPSAITRGASATSTIAVSSKDGYTGTVTFMCALNSGGPANQSGDAPVCTIPTSPVAVGAAATATVTTVAATSGALIRPDFNRNTTALAGMGCAALVLLGVLGIPAQRRALRTIIGMLALIVALGSLAACGGGGGSGGGKGGTTNPGTASGSYAFTVTATGTPAVSPAPTATFTVTVN